MSKLRFIEIYSDIGAGKRGTTHGVAALSAHCEGVYPDAAVDKIHLHASDAQPAHPKAKYIETLTPFFEETLVPKVRDCLAQCEQQNEFPVIISGDHSNAIGSMAAFLSHHQDKRAGIIWLDAHADLHTVYTTPSGNMHGTPVAAALRLDNLACQGNEVDEQVADYWQRLKHLTPNSKGVRLSDVFFLGLRSFEPPEAHLIKTHNIYAYSSIESRHRGLDVVLDELCARLADLDAVYFSFDVDSLDGVLIPATGTPEPCGYMPDELKQIFARCLSLPNVRLFELTEFNPTLDADTDKQALIYTLLDDALACVAKR